MSECGIMYTEHEVNWITLIFFFGYIAFGLISLWIGTQYGRQVERHDRARRDLAAAQQFRTSLREYDSRISEFVSSPVNTAQSTAIVAKPRRRCWIGPEQCECEDCRVCGVPPAP